MRRHFQYLGELTEEGFVEYDRSEVREALLDMEGALHQLGGVVTISAVRREVAPDQFITTGILMAYDSYVPKYEPAVEPAVEEAEVEEEDGARAS